MQLVVALALIILFAMTPTSSWYWKLFSQCRGNVFRRGSASVKAGTGLPASTANESAQQEFPDGTA